MTFEEYKKEMKKRVANFRKAYEELEELFDSIEFDCNDFICDDYPFESSFDEYFNAIADWQYSIEENLENYKN